MSRLMKLMLMLPPEQQIGHTASGTSVAKSVMAECSGGKIAPAGAGQHHSLSERLSCSMICRDLLEMVSPGMLVDNASWPETCLPRRT